MRKHLFFFFFVGLYLPASAHDVNKAYFKIVQHEKQVRVEAEFPWTMRDALIQFKPALKDASSSADFLEAFMEYIRSHLVLKDKYGNALELIDVKEVDQQNHSHQHTYLITFSGKDVHQVQNELMFNIYDNQKNYHTFSINSEKQSFITNADQVSFYVSTNNHFSYWWMLLLILPTIFLFSMINIRRAARKEGSIE